MKGKKQFVSLAVVTAMLSALIACTGNQQLSRGTQGAGMGAIGGAILGQAIGHDTEATLLGTAIGTILGYIVANEMDKTDRQMLNQIYETTPSGRPVSWVNPDNGNNYQVIAQPAYPNPQDSNQYCRKAEIIATIDGQPQKTYTTACRNNRGEWVLRN